MKYVTNQNSTQEPKKRNTLRQNYGILKTRKNNEKNTQKKCQGWQTKRLQNEEKDCPKITILDVNNQQDTIFFLK